MNTFSKNDTAIISIDATESFLNKELNELYVWWEWTELVAPNTKKIISIASKAWYLTINVLEEHPLWHASFASSYTNKKVLDYLTYDEIKDRTTLNNWFSASANVDIDKLKDYLQKQWKMQLRPDHSIEWTLWSKLTPPLKIEDFDKTIVKWDKSHTHPMWPFEETQIKRILDEHGIKNIIMTWVATEFCVKKAAGDATKWYNTFLVQDAIAAVSDAAWEEALESLKSNWVTLISSHEVLKLLAA